MNQKYTDRKVIRMNTQAYDKQIFIQRLKTLRKEKGFSQPELAEILGKTKGALGHWESGTREPGLDIIYKLSEIFNVSVDYMLGTSDFRNENDSIDYMLLKLRECGLVKHNDTLDKKTIDQLMGYIEAIENIKRG